MIKGLAKIYQSFPRRKTLQQAIVLLPGLRLCSLAQAHFNMQKPHYKVQVIYSKILEIKENSFYYASID